MDNQILTIPLHQIADEAIKNAQIRSVNLNTPSSQILKKQLQDEGQKVPIIVRKLRENETTDSGAIYGILDGHHRVAILRELCREEVEAEVVESENEVTDLIKAATPNFSHKSLESWQIGSILVQIKNMMNRKLEYVAADFGIARSTAFKYQAAYNNYKNKSSQNQDLKEPTQYDKEVFKEAIMRINLDEKSDSLEGYEEKFKQAKELEIQLDAYKRYLRSKMKKMKSNHVA